MNSPYSGKEPIPTVPPFGDAQEGCLPNLIYLILITSPIWISILQNIFGK